MTPLAVFTLAMCPAADPPEEARARLLTEIKATWPASGVLTAEYETAGLARHWRKRVRFDFASGAWTLWRADGKNSSSGTTPAGEYYSGDARLEVREQVFADHSGSLDLFFPSFALIKHLERAEAVRDIQRQSDGGYVVTLSMPRGQRDQTLAQLPPALVESLGGPRAIMRTVTFDIGPDLRPRKRSVEGQPDQVYSHADCASGGFAVSARCPWPAEEVQLVSCDFRTDASSAEFELKHVQTGLTAWQRAHGEIRTPVRVPDAPVSPPTVPPDPDARGSAMLQRRAPWLLAGAVVVLIGIIAWVRRRVGA
jgi:hypothetical protein